MSDDARWVWGDGPKAGDRIYEVGQIDAVIERCADIDAFLPGDIVLVTNDPNASRNGVYRLVTPSFVGVGTIAAPTDGRAWVKEWIVTQTIHTAPHLPIWRRNDGI